MGKQKKCEACGKEFLQSNGNQKYCCKTCYEEATRVKSMIWNREKRDRQAEKIKGITRNKAKKSGLTLTAINAAARKAGLNYGEYVAKMHL